MTCRKSSAYSPTTRSASSRRDCSGHGVSLSEAGWTVLFMNLQCDKISGPVDPDQSRGHLRLSRPGTHSPRCDCFRRRSPMAKTPMSGARRTRKLARRIPNGARHLRLDDRAGGDYLWPMSIGVAPKGRTLKAGTITSAAARSRAPSGTSLRPAPCSTSPLRSESPSASLSLSRPSKRRTGPRRSERQTYCNFDLISQCGATMPGIADACERICGRTCSLCGQTMPGLTTTGSGYTRKCFDSLRPCAW